MSVVVAEEGNRRVGDMNADEVDQCVLDIKSWFNRTKGRERIRDGATSADLQRLEKAVDIPLPRPLKTLLREANGGLYFLEKQQLSAEEIHEFVDGHERSRLWKSGWLPFCKDDSSALLIDTNRADSIWEWDIDDGLGDEVAPNLVRYLENYRNDLLSGRFDYVDDLGVVENMGKASHQSRK
eukprot:gene5600-6167_t